MTEDIQKAPLNDLLTAWHEAEKQADYWTVREKALRVEICSRSFKDPRRGTNKLRIDHGMALIMDYRINCKIDVPVMEASKGFIPVDVFESVINYRPEVRTAWFKLDDEKKKLFAPFITETPGTPSLEIKPQNKVRW